MTIDQQYPTHLPPNLGDMKSDELLDAELAFSIKRADLEYARSALDTKWWDYRYVHPGRCFYLFAELYGKALEEWRTKFGTSLYAKLKNAGPPLFRCITETVRDPKTKRQVEGITYHEQTSPAARTGLWRAMCFADSYGIPYDRFIQLAFEHAFEFKAQRMPQPTHLYTAYAIEWITKAWDEETKNIMRVPTDPRFLAKNYIGDRWQNDFQDWLLELIAARPRPAIPLHHYTVQEPFLVPSRAQLRFPHLLVPQTV